MRVAITLEFTDGQRATIAHYFTGKTRPLATRQLCRDFVRVAIYGELETANEQLQEELEEEAGAPSA